MLAVRPERVKLIGGAAGENQLAGRITEAVYQGDRIRYEARLESGAVIAAIESSGAAPRFAPATPSPSRWTEILRAFFR